PAAGRGVSDSLANDDANIEKPVAQNCVGETEWKRDTSERRQSTYRERTEHRRCQAFRVLRLPVHNRGDSQYSHTSQRENDHAYAPFLRLVEAPVFYSEHGKRTRQISNPVGRH